MPAIVRRTCDDCGFENAEPEKPCPLCGRSAARYATLDGEKETQQFPPTRRIGEEAPDAPHAAASAVGCVFGDRYAVSALLGSGGMGQVYRVLDRKENRERALKLLHPTEEGDGSSSGRFRREAQILARIQHPAVPRILDSGVADGRLFIVTELIDGQDLKLQIHNRGPWPVAEAVSLTATVAEALHAAHVLGIVHRDVKPNNIMVARDGSVRLLDFGLARGKGVDMATLTRTGVVVGTPAYMSPEQFQALAVDERSDIYALGIVLYELLTARLPFTAPTPMALALKHIQEPAPSPRLQRPELPAWLDRLVLQCLEKDPARRFASAQALAAELRRDRSTARLRARRLKSGDQVLEDEGQTSEWALVLQTPGARVEWSSGMALRFEERFYRLERVDAPPEKGGRWTFRFSSWPEGVVFRRLVDYVQDAAEREVGTRSGRFARFLSGRKE
jgi:serine/threonine protein kinase